MNVQQSDLKRNLLVDEGERRETRLKLITLYEKYRQLFKHPPVRPSRTTSDPWDIKIKVPPTSANAKLNFVERQIIMKLEVLFAS